MWNTSEERNGRYAYNDGVNILSADRTTEQSTLFTDSYLWRFDGEDINSVKFVSKLDGKSLYSVVISGNNTARLNFTDLADGDLWRIDLNNSTVDNAKTFTNLSGTWTGYFNPHGSAGSSGHEGWGFGVYNGGNNFASAMFIYPVYNTLISVAQDVEGGTYGVQTAGTYAYDLIETKSVSLVATANDG